MPRKLLTCGPWFWVWTFVIGVFSPGKGKRRINSRMKELTEAVAERDKALSVQESNNTVLAKDNEFLREQLAEKTAEVNHLQTALQMEEAVKLRVPSWAKESPDDKVDTVPIPVVN